MNVRSRMPDDTSFMPLSPEYLSQIQREDQFLLAFPRSGSRWLRYMLSDVFNQHLGQDPMPLYDAMFARQFGARVPQIKGKVFLSEDVIPDVHTHPYSNCVLPRYGVKPTLRSHHLTEVLQRSQGAMIGVFRSPVLVLGSYYHFARQGKHIGETVSLREFSQWKLPLWMDHLQILLEARRQDPGRFLLMHYTGKMPFGAAEVEAAAQHFGIPCQPGAAEAAMANCLQHLAQVNAHPSTTFPRGENVQSLALIPDVVRQEIEAATASIYEEAVAAAVGNLPLTK